MKTTMKLFAALTIMLGFTVTTFAQTNPNDDATISANATVVGQIAVDNVQNLDFGLMYASGPKTILLDGTPQDNITGGTQDQGIFKITKGTGSTVSLVFTQIPSVLTGPTATMGITYVAKWTTDANDGTGGTSVSVNPAIPTPTAGGLTDPIFYVHLGGTVTPAVGGTQATETYTANVKLKATFN